MQGPRAISKELPTTTPVAILGIVPIRGERLLSCTTSHNVSKRVIHGCYIRIRCYFREGPHRGCTLKFTGSRQNFRLQGDVFGKYTCTGSVAYVDRNGESYTIFRNFFSLLDFGRCTERRPRVPTLKGLSIYMLGSATVISHSGSFLSGCRGIRTFLSGSTPKHKTLKGVQDFLPRSIVLIGRSRHLCPEYGSFGRFLRGAKYPTTKRRV